MNPLVPRALVVEDDRSWRQILSEILTDFKFEVDVAENFDQAIKQLRADTHRLAVVDLSLSPKDHNNTDGLQVLSAARLIDPYCRTILLTGFATVELAVSALSDFNAFTFLRKESFSRNQFRDIINKILTSAPQYESSDVRIPVDSKLDLSENNPNTGKATIEGKALVVDDDAGWRSIIEELLLDIGYQVRACTSFGEAFSYLRRDRFKLAVIDMSLKGASINISSQYPANQNLEGFQLLEATNNTGVVTIVVSGVASPEDIKRAYSEQSVFAYLEKQTFDKGAFKRIVEEASATPALPTELHTLTDREREVFNLLAQGLTNKEIAEKLYITTNTVKRHLKAIFEKLNVHTRAAATSKAAGEKG